MLQHRNHNKHDESLVVTGSKEHLTQISPLNSSRKKEPVESPKQ